MRIAELESKYKKYGLDRRTIDYYSSDNVKLIPYEREEGSNYRIYGDEAEAVIKKIIILRDVGFSSRKIKEALDNPSYFTTAMWNKHIEELKAKLAEVEQHYKDIIQYAEDMRDSSSLPLNLPNGISNPKAMRAYTHMYARILKYISSPDKLTELSESLDDDLSDFSNCCVVFLKSIERKIESGLTPESEEVQQSVEKFIQRMNNHFGTIVYLFIRFAREMDFTVFFDDDDEEDALEPEEIELFMHIFDLCAEWFRYAKTVDAALDFDAFATRYASEIQEIDKEFEESMIDDITDIIKEICDLPSHIPSLIDEFKGGYSAGVRSVAIADGASQEEVEEAMEYGDFIFRALETYFAKQKANADCAQAGEML